ncbi:MAG TPA: prepilin-type N-terminal cleavage/methylation domain-containing protein, partial [Candidatus Dormibacteraeota bacterium]|nr:prepilin-type N-terminal cleavage/methylation domain-containing protein [Candidatus Dormibacteraeota bacterium]
HRGFTLVELLVGVLAFALFAVGVQQFTRTMLRGVRVLEAAAEAQEAARLGVQLIAGDLRDAGFSPTGALGNGLRRAAPDAVALVRDLNGDGDSDDANEAVAYQYAADRRCLLRAPGGAPPQPLLNDVPDGGVRFSFVGADGGAFAGGELDPAARALVRRVVVRFVVEVANPDPADSRPLRAEQQATVVLRNG